MISHGKWQAGPVADLFFRAGAEEEMTIHCFCSRAFVRFVPLKSLHAFMALKQQQQQPHFLPATRKYCVLDCSFHLCSFRRLVRTHFLSVSQCTLCS